MVIKMEGNLITEAGAVIIQLEDGTKTELLVGDKLEILVFTALVRFEWITVELGKNDSGEFYFKSPNSRKIPFTKISKVRID